MSVTAAGRMTTPAALLAPPLAQATPRSGTPIFLAIIIISVMLPQELSFFVGDTRLTVTRLIMFIAFPLVLGRFLAVVMQRPGANIADIAVLAAAGWYLLAAMNNTIAESNPRWLFFAGSAALELCVVYLLARVYVLTTAQAKSALQLFCVCVACVGFLGILDVVTGQWFLRNTLAALAGVSPPNEGENIRYGVFRATSTLEHPILFGTLCAIALTIALNVPTRFRLFIVAGCITGVATSVSTGAMSALVLGVAMTIYARLPLFETGRWGAMFGALTGCFGLIFLLHPRPWSFIFNYLTLSPETGFYRYLIWDTFLPFVWEHPIYGFGNPLILTTAAQMSHTVDAHWLMLMIIMGIPGMLMVAVTMIGCSAVCTSKLSPRGSLRSKIGLALGISIGIYIYVGFTVYYWGTLFIVGSLLAGMRSAIGSVAATDVATPGMDLEA